MQSDFDPTPLIAIYAALVSTAGVAWQIYSWRREHATRLVVETSWGFLTMNDGAVSEQMTMITVYNRSAHEIGIVAGGFLLEQDRKTSLPIIHPPIGATIPGTIPGRSVGRAWLPVVALEESLRSNNWAKGTELRGYCDDGAGTRHLAKKR